MTVLGGLLVKQLGDSLHAVGREHRTGGVVRRIYDDYARFRGELCLQCGKIDLKILVAGHFDKRAAGLLDIDLVLGKVRCEHECFLTLGHESGEDDSQRR